MGQEFGEAQPRWFIARPLCLGLSGANTGGDGTPGGWNGQKVIYAHVWCLGWDDSKARTADWSTHAELPMGRDFLPALQPESSQAASAGAQAPRSAFQPATNGSPLLCPDF